MFDWSAAWLKEPTASEVEKQAEIQGLIGSQNVGRRNCSKAKQVMSVNETVCLEDAIVRAEAPPSRKELRQRRPRSHAESDAESATVEKHLPLVKTIVGRIAVSLPPLMFSLTIFIARDWWGC